MNLELCEIADRVMKQPGGGKALLFEHPILHDGTRSAFPVAINLFGSMRRMAMSLGVESLDEIGARITELLEMKVPEGHHRASCRCCRGCSRSGSFRRACGAATPPCQEVVWRGDEIDLDKLPLIKCWPEDGGPYITLPMVITRDPEARHSQRRHVSRACRRARRRSPCTGSATRSARRTGARWPSAARRCRCASRSAPIRRRCIRRARRCRRRSTSFCSPDSCDASPCRSTKAVTCDLEVPAEAEFVIEGYIDPAEALVTEGPFGDHTGFYSLADLYPQVHVTAITMRRVAVFPTTIVGRPPMEDFYLGHATERIFLPLLKLTMPEIVDYHMPAEGIFHNLVFVSIKKEYPGQAYKVMNALWGQGLMSLAKVLVVVDQWVNVRDPQEAWWVALNNIDPRARRAVHDGPDGRARSLEPRLHLRLEDGHRRDAKAARGGLHARLAGRDRDG